MLGCLPPPRRSGRGLMSERGVRNQRQASPGDDALKPIVQLLLSQFEVHLDASSFQLAAAPGVCTNAYVDLDAARC